MTFEEYKSKYIPKQSKPKDPEEFGKWLAEKSLKMLRLGLSKKNQ
jgi:hypothetical protein